jgi:hypothetical protein
MSPQETPLEKMVITMPMKEIWSADVTLPSKRLRQVGLNAIQSMLKMVPLQFLVADIGHPLRWIPPSETFSFWKKEVRPHLIDPTAAKWILKDFPGEYVYVASEWSEPPHLILLEKYH